MASGDRLQNPQPLDLRGIAQANISSTGRKIADKGKHRASVACSACRARRTRCFVPAGDEECIQCKISGIDCIIKNDDERKRRFSRAHMRSLEDRIAFLESTLKQQSVDAPPTNAIEPSSQSSNHQEDVRKSLEAQVANTSLASGAQYSNDEQPQSHNIGSFSMPMIRETVPPSKANATRDSVVQKILSTSGYLSLDQFTGIEHYFGPTTNCHIHSHGYNSPDRLLRRNQQKDSLKIIMQTLTEQTHDYLMDMFWQNHNSVIHTVHKGMFYDNMHRGQNRCYSTFLHLTMLAIGYRYADKSRRDLAMISLPNRYSILHREAKSMLDCELERLGGIPSIIALLLLGDLEAAMGRENVGWIYASIATRLCFDVGLHLENHNPHQSKLDLEIGRMTLWACVIYDKYWALYLGRPTCLKTTDLEIYNLTVQFERLGACHPTGQAKGQETIIYEALLDLMELTGKIIDIINPNWKPGRANNTESYPELRLVALDRELQSWYSSLSSPLQWNQENIQQSPSSYFLLHQQYHCTQILLHRPSTRDEQSIEPSFIGNAHSSDLNQYISNASQKNCTRHAIHMCEVFTEYGKRFDITRIFVAGVQHAGTAATALIAAITFAKDSQKKWQYTNYLEGLANVMKDLTQLYKPAEQMTALLHSAMAELRPGMMSLEPVVSSSMASEEATLQDGFDTVHPYTKYNIVRGEQDSLWTLDSSSIDHHHYQLGLIRASLNQNYGGKEQTANFRNERMQNQLSPCYGATMAPHPRDLSLLEQSTRSSHAPECSPTTHHIPPGQVLRSPWVLSRDNSSTSFPPGQHKPQFASDQAAATFTSSAMGQKISRLGRTTSSRDGRQLAAHYPLWSTQDFGDYEADDDNINTR